MSTDQRILADPVTQAQGGTEDITDGALAALLATAPYVKRSGPYLTIETQAREVPERPETCPACGESYKRRSFPRRGEAVYVHHMTGFGGDVCTVPCEWTPQRIVTVLFKRAKRVSGR